MEEMGLLEMEDSTGDPSLSVSQSHLNTRVTLEKGRLSIQGD